MKKNYFTILTFLAATMLMSAQEVTEDFTDASYVDGPLSTHAKWTVGTPAQYSIEDAANRIKSTAAYARAIYTPVFKGASGTIITATAWVECGAAAAGFNSNDGDFVTVIGFKHEAAAFNNNSEAVRVLSNVGGPGSGLSLVHLGPSGAFDAGATGGTIPTASKGEYKVTAELSIGASAALSTFSAKLENVATGESTTVAVKTGIYAPLYNEIVSGLATEGAHFYVHSQTMGNLSPTLVNKFEIGNATTLSVSSYKAVEFGTFPNPANNILNVSTLRDITSIKVHSITGKMLLSQEGGDQVNISSLSSGMYLLTVSSGDDSSTSKFIKK